MSNYLALLVVLVLFGSFSAAENDDSLIVSFSKHDLTSVIDGLVRERIAEIESGFKHDISVFKSANEVLKSKVDSIENGFELLEVENSQLKAKVVSIENELGILKTAVSYTPPDQPENDTQADNVSRRVAPYHPSPPQVAFLARLTHTLTNVGPEQTITFDAVEINVGNNYNAATSVFTCEIPGLYVFHLTVMIYPDKHAELHFVKNGNLWHNFYSADKGYAGADSTTTLIQLDKGDTVWIKAILNHSPGDLMHQNYSYFSGFLLYPRI